MVVDLSLPTGGLEMDPILGGKVGLYFGPILLGAEHSYESFPLSME